MDHSSDMDSEDEMGRRDLRRVYLVTYSQADVEKFPTRNSFALAVVAALSRASTKVIQWCCSLENHEKSWGPLSYMCKVRKVTTLVGGKKLSRTILWYISTFFG